MPTVDLIIELFCRIDDVMDDVPKHSQAKLYPSEIVTLGMLFAIKGVGNRAFYRWINNEAVLSIQSIISQTDGNPLGTLGTNNRPIDKLTGLLVKVWGRVTHKAADGSYIYIDDGSGLNDGNAGGHLGVRVILNGLVNPITKIISDNPASYVAVTGLVGKLNDGGLTVPVIRPRGDADITMGGW
ncbi:MAG: hypothetical protein HYX78_00875 [Armatimonadetes bacterium]|nr:hypothetical protein [Armatimonadota bacterium]